MSKSISIQDVGKPTGRTTGISMFLDYIATLMNRVSLQGSVSMKSPFLILILLVMHGVLRAAPVSEEKDLSAFFGDSTGAFVLYDAAKEKWVRHRADLCKERVTPCSTFKIPNSLIALEAGVADGPDFLLKWDGTKRPIEPWNQDHTLRSAIGVSCVWYYQELARRTGQKRMDELLGSLRYGNGDTSGGLTEFWLESTLKISPDEQVDFLRRMQTRQLPVSAKAVDVVLDITVISREGDTVYRGKTGTAGSLATGLATRGWWVGSLATPRGDFYFATCITGGKNPSGKEARRITEAVLAELGVMGKK